jgi:hypothetical protein
MLGGFASKHDSLAIFERMDEVFIALGLGFSVGI